MQICKLIFYQFCFSAMGNCGLYFRDRIETFDLTEAELNVENNKDQTENERVTYFLSYCDNF